MAVEARRGCGFRKVGGLYLVGVAMGEPCHRLPKSLATCPTCGHGIKRSRGFTWVDATELLSPPCDPGIPFHCEVCHICKADMGQAGLIWVGEQFYPMPEHFLYEANRLGISRRIKAVPNGFQIGKTWVLLGHAKAAAGGPGIFMVFLPQRIEAIIKKSEATDEKINSLMERGLTPVIVPDDDKDHAPSADDEDEGKGAPSLIPEG